MVETSANAIWCTWAVKVLLVRAILVTINIHYYLFTVKLLAAYFPVMASHFGFYLYYMGTTAHSLKICADQ